MKAGEYMKSAMPLKKIIFKVFIILFTINASFCILSGGIIPSYGLFGEATSFYAVETQESGIQSNPIKSNSNKRYKTRINDEQQKVLYEWLVLIITILSILYLQYWFIFSNYITPVVLKVRMNN
jgi:hypothetical protein